MLAVVGMGNPGAAYRRTRHNAGFMVLDGMVGGRFGTDSVSFAGETDANRRAFDLSGKMGRSASPYVKLEGAIGNRRFLFVKPTTFMNESGKALTSLFTKGMVRDVSEILVVVDDVDLDVGRIRFREKGSAGGHNGLKSIIAALGSDEFARIKIGVGYRPVGVDLADYVLGSFRPEEYETMDNVLHVAALCVEAWLAGGAEGVRKEISKVLNP